MKFYTKCMLSLTLALLGLSGMCSAAGYRSNAVIGTVETILYAKNDPDATVGETTLGNAMADVVRTQCGTDAVILCGGDFRGNLQGGPVTPADIEMVFEPDRTLVTVRVSPAQLRALLEAGVSGSRLAEDETLDPKASAFDGFPQVSGFSFIYDVTDLVGERVKEIRMEDGRILDLADTEPSITLAATEHMLSGGYGMPTVEEWESTGCTVTEMAVDYFQENETLHKPEQGRIVVKGAVTRIMDRIPLALVLVAMVFLGFGSGNRVWKQGRTERF